MRFIWKQLLYQFMINSCKLNHLFYSDDSVILGPSPRSLQDLIDLCSEYASKHELSFNIKKIKVT